MNKPFAFREADLPTGFPPPAPVGEVVVKDYPAYRAAVRRAKDGENQNQLFRPLFNHIKRRDIAMSSPVEMTYDDSAAQPTSMAFIYGDPSIGQPGADEGNVQVIDVPAQTVISVGVRGSYDSKHFQQGVKQLHDWLAAHPDYTPAGPPRYLAYNSPFVPWFMRFGEVQLPVRRVNP